MSSIRSNSFYQIVEGSSWTQAESNAVNLGGHLVTINDASENNWLVENFVDHVSFNGKVGDKSGDARYTPRAWIGLTDQDDEGNYKWISGEPLTYFQPTKDYQLTGLKDTYTGLYEGDTPRWRFIDQDYISIQLGNASTSDWLPGYWEDVWNNHWMYEQGIAEVPLSYFSISDLTVSEGNSGTVTISRTGGNNTVQNLSLTSSDGTATAGSDYTPINQTITFGKGETTKTISIGTIEDSKVEVDEFFNLSLSALATDVIPAQIQDGNAIVTISNDDKSSPMSTATELQQLYLAYFGRPADPTGLNYWLEKGTSTSAFAANMYAQPEFIDTYGSLPVADQVNQIYQNLFCRDAEIEGLLYWVNEINSGRLQLASIANDLIWAANNNPSSIPDKNILDKKTNVAVAFTAEIAASVESILCYQPNTPIIKAAKELMDSICDRSFLSINDIRIVINDNCDFSFGPPILPPILPPFMPPYFKLSLEKDELTGINLNYDKNESKDNTIKLLENLNQDAVSNTYLENTSQKISDKSTDNFDKFEIPNKINSLLSDTFSTDEEKSIIGIIDSVFTINNSDI